ncbi:MAG: hypothetical protein OES38_19090 [Gammaproteobacteria bacterium]|nr:hypothetical protein [Gammaproteobacteria bacterium]
MSAAGTTNRSDQPTDTMDKRLQRDVQAWDDIHEHRTGTPGDATTAEWLAREAHAAGAQTELDWFAFQRRVPGECSVSAGGRRVEGLPMFDGGFTSPQSEPEGHRGPLQALDAVSGIGLVEFGPGPWHRGTQVLERARLANALQAIVAVAADEQIAPGLAVLNAEHYQKPFGPVVLQVGTGARNWLLDLKAKRTPVTVIAEAPLEHTRAANVMVRIPGSDESLAPLVVMTPRSGWFTCTSERGGGIAIWLECIRYFGVNPPERTVLFTANTGHELGHIGLEHYLQRHHDLIAGAHAWLHLGANFAASAGAIRFQASPAFLADGVAELATHGINDPTTTPPHERPLGEARDIFDGGGRYVSLLGSNRMFHHPDDRWPDAVDMDKLSRLAKAMLAIAAHLAHA